MNDLNEILADIKHEDELNPFDALDTETNTSSESLTENEPEDEEPEPGISNAASDEESEENSPFHKRWKQREDKLKADMESDFQERFEEYKRSIDETISPLREQDSSNEDVPESFQRLYGNDPVAYAAWREEQQRLKQETVQETIAEIERVKHAEVEEKEYWQKWVDIELTKLEERGESFDRNALMKTMLDYRPTTDDNNLDFEAGLGIYKALNASSPAPVDPAKSQARKQIADAATKATVSEPRKKDFLTPHDLRNKSWNSL